MYSKCGYFSYARKVFDKMPVKDVVSWNTVLSGFFRNGLVEEGFGWFNTMYGDAGVCRFDPGSVTTVLSACDECEFSNVVKMVHGLVVLYRNVVTWTAMISGLARNQFCEESFEVFVEMRKGLVGPNTLTYLSLLMACSGLKAVMEGCQIHGLMDMYCKCGGMREAWQIFASAQALKEILI
nr:hypothetical protein [Tanacetum cinerariifolium]